MTTHTPGPWEAFKGKVVGRDPDDLTVVVADVRTLRAAADARLLAAAPDLLAACEAVAGVYRDRDDMPLYARRCIAALTKARGVDADAPEGESKK